MTEVLKTIFENINTPLGSMLLLGLAGYLWIRYHLKNTEYYLKNTDKRISRLETVALGNNEILQIILTCLSREKIMRIDDWSQITKIKDTQIEALLKQEEKKENPLSREEIQDLRTLYQKIKQGQPLSLPEAERFNVIVDKLKEQRPDHSGTWILAALAGLVLGWALGSSQKNG